MRYPSTVVSLVLLASQAAASSVSVSRVKARGTLPSLLARQTGGSTENIPTQCDSACLIIYTVNACLNDDCICTSANMDGLQNCFDCVFTADPNPELEAETQSEVDAIVAACESEGYTVPGITIVASGTPASTPPPATGSSSSSSPSSVSQTAVFNTNSPSVTFNPSSGASTNPSSTPGSSSNPTPASSSSDSSSALNPSSSSGSGSGGVLGKNAAVASAASGVLLAGAVGAVALALAL